MIGRHDNRGALRLRVVDFAAPPSPRRRFAPALMVAIVAHAVLVAGLVAWRLPLRQQRTAHHEPVSATISFAGLRDADGGGGTPDAGGSGGGGQSVVLLPAQPKPHFQTPPPPVIPPNVFGPVTVEAPQGAFVVGAVSLDASARPSFAGVGNGTGTGNGNGTGTGMGDGHGPGIAGTGTGNGLGRPNYLRSPNPRYPSQARQNGWEGTTVLRVEVLAQGVTGSIEVVQSSGYRVLDEAAIEAVREARFQPARLEGVAVVAWVEVPITFRLNRG